MKGVYFMRKNSVFFRFCIMFLIFFLGNRSVYAAQELTCVYQATEGSDKQQVILVQRSDGTKVLYKNKNVDKKNPVTHDIGDDGWYRSDDQAENSGFKQSEWKNLKQCPPSKTTSSLVKGEVTFYSNKTGKQLLDQSKSKNQAISPIKKSSDYKIQELTCVYKKKDDKAKIAFTQNSFGDIVIYKNSEDVSIDTESNYWKETYVEPTFNVKGYNKENDDFLKSCPASMSSSSSILSGEKLTFYEKKEDGDVDLESYAEKVLPVQIRKSTNSTTNNKTNFDSEKNSGKKCSEIPLKDKWLMEKGDYNLTCLYEKYYSKSSYCNIIQVSIGNSGVFTKTNEKTSNWQIDDTAIEEAKAQTLNEGNCPSNLFVKRNSVGRGGTQFTTVTTISISFDGKGTTYRLAKDEDKGEYGQEGKNMITGAEATNNFDVSIDFTKITIESCDDLFNGNSEIVSGLKTIVTVVKILIPIILLVLGSLDFAKAIFSSNEEGIKKAQASFIKRLIIAVVIFLIPSMLKVILNIAYSIWPIIDPELCGII